MCEARTCAAMAHVQQWHMCSSGTCARFNSKLVRIRSVRGAMNCATTSQEDKGFNSKLVRIRSVRGAMNCATTSQENKDFDSKLVRLEEKLKNWMMLQDESFQFQTGAIRRRNAMGVFRHTDNKFQFQTGSIRRNGRVSCLSVRYSFNSKLVRLEVLILMIIQKFA